MKTARESDTSTPEKSVQRKPDEIVRLIFEGIASDTGEALFHSLVQNLAIVLKVKYAFVSEFTKVSSRVRTLAFWHGKDFIENFEYDLVGTPCERVLKGKICYYPQRVQSLFPRDMQLKGLHAQSYIAIPLIDESEKVLGHLAVLDDQPMPDAQQDMSIFRIFAARATAELVRRKMEQALRDSEERFATILESTMDAVITIDRNFELILLNKAGEEVFGSAPSHLRSSFADYFSASFKSIFETYLESCDRGLDELCQIWAPEGITAIRADRTEFPIEATISETRVGKEKLYTIVLRDIDQRKQAEQAIQKLQFEKAYLKERIDSYYNFAEIIGQSPTMQKVFANIGKVADTDSTVLITGETGTGKELVARAIHNLSRRKNEMLVTVNCAALPEGLSESELFGHEKGAFTGATSRKRGRFELADKGTIFLDEVGDLSAQTQKKLLRVLQEREFERLGGTKTLMVDVRVLAATNHNLEEDIKAGRFRADLFYRLNIFVLYLPPLRERLGDIPLLVEHFLFKFSKKQGKSIRSVNQRAMNLLLRHDWPGNVRELANSMERAVILCDTTEIQPQHIVINQMSIGKSDDLTLEHIEREHINRVLQITKGVVGGSHGAARILGLNRTTLIARMKKLGLDNV